MKREFLYLLTEKLPFKPNEIRQKLLQIKTELFWWLVLTLFHGLVTQLWEMVVRSIFLIKSDLFCFFTRSEVF